MMPVCGFKKLVGRCHRVAIYNIGEIVLPGEVDGFGKPWKQPHYLCYKHWAKLMGQLGFEAPGAEDD